MFPWCRDIKIRVGFYLEAHVGSWYRWANPVGVDTRMDYLQRVLVTKKPFLVCTVRTSGSKGVPRVKL